MAVLAYPDMVILPSVNSHVNVKPVFVSPGYLIDLYHSMEFVLTSFRRFRSSGPIRAAYKLASDAFLPD